MERINKAEEQYKQSRKQSRAQRLKAEFEDKSFADEWRGTYYLSKGTSVIFQGLSLLTAISLPAYAIKIASNSWALGFALGAIILFLLEAFKRYLLPRAVKKGLQYGKYFSFAGFIAFCLMVASICFSTFGTPVLIQQFGAAPTLENTDIKLDDSHIIAMNAEIAKLEQEKNTYFEDNKKKNNFGGFRLSSKYMPTYNGMIANISDLKQSRNDAEKALKIKQDEAITAATANNTTALQEDEKSKSFVGFILGGVTLLFELVFVGTMFFCKYYDYRETLELEEEGAQSGAKVRSINDSDNEKKKNLIKQAQELRAENMSLRAIGRELEISHTQVANLLKEAVN